MSESTVRKFMQLKDQCMERYCNREQRVALTLNFCVTALEKLGSWATFAIFPIDELNEESYLSFVKQRFVCVISPLQSFKDLLQRHFEASFKESGLEHKTMFSFEENKDWRNLPLKDKVSFMSKHFLNEGLTVKNLVMKNLSSQHKDMELLFQWVFKTIQGLEAILDDAMTDELYFMVRGKLSRTLSKAGVFEEAAEGVEKNMSRPADVHSDRGKQSEMVARQPDLTQSLPANLRHFNIGDRTSSQGNVSSSIQQHSRCNASTISSDETIACDGTPEPPFSPRPQILLSHPKINKDMKMKMKESDDLLHNSW